MQRAAISVTLNIAEGWARNHTKEFIQFLYISVGSLAELDTIVVLCTELNLLKTDGIVEIRNDIEELRKMIYATIKSLSSLQMCRK